MAGSGYHVFATVRSEADADRRRGEGLATLVPVLLDVTDATQIEAAYAQIAGAVGDGGLMAIINNAGVNYTTATEEADLRRARAVFEPLFWRAVSIVQRFLPLLRAYGHRHPDRARIINVSSVGRISAFPYIQFHKAAKFAVIGFTESLRLELNPFGIKAIAVLPGAVKTEIWRKANDSAQEALADEGSVYREYLQQASAFSNSYQDSGVSAEKAARVLKRALEDRRPDLKYFIGTDAMALHLMVRLLPDTWRHWILRGQLGF